MAFWVLAAHCLGAAGYEIDQLHGVLRIVRDAGYAVDVFVIVSGFVISHLIVRSREPYGTFIGRRFFRLFPLYAICMIAGALLTNAAVLNLHASAAWLTEHRLNSEIDILASIFHNFWQNAALCSVMLQGTVPQSVVPYAPVAFLGTAWSISLEWQFYLVATLLVPSILDMKGRAPLVISWVSILAVFVLAQLKFLPQVIQGAFLPYHIEFFLMGIASYGVLLKFATPCKQEGADSGRKAPFLFAALVVSVLLFPIAAGAHALLPYLIWAVLLALLVQKQIGTSDIFARALDGVLSNRFILFLGEISYGIYLLHLIVIILIQRILFVAFPQLGQLAHCLSLLIAVSLFTIALSAILHYTVERPSMRFAKRLFASKAVLQK